MLSERRAHTTLPASDVDRLRAWYEGVLGFTPNAIRPGAVLYKTGAHTQMAFTVDDIDAEVADLKARGVVFESYEAPRTVDGIATIGAGRAAWFKDPDGKLLAVIQFSEPT